MRKIVVILGTFFFISLLFSCQVPTKSGKASSTLEVDGSKRYQQIDGFGVNINTTWWNNGEYLDTKVTQPAIDLLVDSLGATLYRAVIEEIDWEAINDDDNPDNFNWTYYNSVFSNERFQSVWNTLRYLNKKGITDGLIISFMGSPPASLPLAEPDPKRSWMGSTNHSISAVMEDEFVESIAALLYYMRHTATVQFNLISPMNETDVISGSKSADHPNGIVEGPNIPDAGQYVRVVSKLAKKLDDIGMGDIRFVAPDAAWDRLFGECLDEMVKDSSLMSKLAYWGVHQYGNDAGNYLSIINRQSNPNKSYWVTETAGISNMLGQLDDSATAFIFWDGFDCVYQHGRRNGYGSVPPNDWVFWLAGEKGKPLIEYVATDKSWKPRKQFYEHAQLMKYIKPGSMRIGITGQDSNIVAHAWRNSDGSIVIAGRNNSDRNIIVKVSLINLPVLKNIKLIYTNSSANLMTGNEPNVSGESFKASIPAESVFTMTGTISSPISRAKPEPEGWYAGDIHVHRSCNNGPAIPVNDLSERMEVNDLSVISVLADIGNSYAPDRVEDLGRVDGNDAPQSSLGRIIHFSAEWHWDADQLESPHQALGGHLIILGLTEAHKIWEESPYKILEWAKKQEAVCGFAHMQYLKDRFPNELNCCIPLDYPIEAALGTIDFISEDVNGGDPAIQAYYKLLNCGFKLGLAAGTDFPCNGGAPFGSLLTYVKINDKKLTYRKWIEGIKNGKTVVSRNGHNEFLELAINGRATPGDVVELKRKGSVAINVKWTAVKEMTGTIELVSNGKVVSSQLGTVRPGESLLFKTTLEFPESGWICARRMNDKGHQSHTAPIYIEVDKKPMSARPEDAKYFITWIDNMILNITPGGKWSHFFTQDTETVLNRYKRAREVYSNLLVEMPASK